MNQGLLLVLVVVLFVGLHCMRQERKVLGGFLTGLTIAVFLAVLPWSALNALSAKIPRFHRWLAPRTRILRIGWGAASICLGAAAGMAGALKSFGPSDADWKVPKDSPAVDKELARILKAKIPGGETFLGVTKSGRRLRLAARERDGHMQVIGPTRSGKSQFLLAMAAQDMAAGSPLFFMEAKGDEGDFTQFLKIAASCGRDESVRYFNPQDPRSMTFNPIRPVAGKDATAVANQIARAIGREPTSSGQGQDYYRGVDYAKVQSMAEVFLATGRAFTLRDCYYYFAFPEARTEAFSHCGDRQLVALAESEFKSNPDSSGLTSALRPWTSGALGDLLNSYAPQIRLEDVFDQTQAAYFAVPVGHLQVLANPLGRMIISGLLSVAAARQRMEPKPAPATVILDEFAEFATPVFASFVATVGSAKIRTTLSHQDLGQLRRVEGIDADAFESIVFNNTSGCKVCFRAPDPDDAEFWSKMLGTHTTTRDTEAFQSALIGGDQKTGSISRRMVERFKLHPNAIKSMEPGTALIMAPGRAEGLIRTARVWAIANRLSVPTLQTPQAVAEIGLDLRSAVPKYKALAAPGGKS
jgi:hypothetical protein